MDEYSVIAFTQYMISTMHIVHTVNCYCMIHLSSIYGTFVIDQSITSVCSEMISYMFSCNCYSHMKLYFYDSCSTCYRFMLNATIRYCFVSEPTIWESSIWGPLIWGPSYGDHLMGTIDIRRYQYEELE